MNLVEAMVIVEKWRKFYANDSLLKSRRKIRFNKPSFNCVIDCMSRTHPNLPIFILTSYIRKVL